MVANSFVLEKNLLQKGLVCRTSKQEVTKVVSLVKMAENLPNVSSPLKLNFLLNERTRYFVRIVF